MQARDYNEIWRERNKQLLDIYNKDPKITYTSLCYELKKTLRIFYSNIHEFRKVAANNPVIDPFEYRTAEALLAKPGVKMLVDYVKLHPKTTTTNIMESKYASVFQSVFLGKINEVRRLANVKEIPASGGWKFSKKIHVNDQQDLPMENRMLAYLERELNYLEITRKFPETSMEEIDAYLEAYVKSKEKNIR